jgi:hypothetical protein
MKVSKKSVEKKIEALNKQYREKTILHKEYLQQIIPLMEEYEKTDISTSEKIKTKGLLIALKGLKFLK